MIEKELLRGVFSGKQSDSLLDLRKRFRSETNSERKAEFAVELADEATRQRYDMLAIAETMDLLVADESPESLVGLRRIRDYFDEVGVVQKMLSPGEKPNQECRKLRNSSGRTMQMLLERINTHQMRVELGEDLYTIVQTINIYEESLLDEDRKYGTLIPLPISLNKELIIGWNESLMDVAVEPIITSYAEGHRALEQRDISGHLRAVSGIMQNVRDMSDHCNKNRAPKEFDYYSRGMGGVSLKMLDRRKVDFNTAASEKRYLAMLHRFFSGLPEGDFLWRMLSVGLFLTPSVVQAKIALEPDKSKYFGEEQAWFNKMTVWQRYIAENLLLPRIENTSGTDRAKADEKVRSFLKQVNDGLYVRMGSVLSLAMLRGVGTKLMFNPPESRPRLERQTPLYSLVESELGLGVESSKVARYLWKRWPKLKAELDDLMRQNGDRRGFFVKIMEDMINPGEYAKEMRERVVMWTDDFFGEALLSELKRQNKSMMKTTTRMLEGIHELPFSRWGETNVDVFVNLGNRSVAKRLGVNEVRLRFPNSFDEKIQFVVQTSDPEIAVGGEIDLHNDLVELNDLKLPRKIAYLETMMKWITACVFHDIVGRKQSRWRRGVKEDQDAQRQLVTNTGTRIKVLPRKWYMLDEEQLLEQFFEVVDPKNEADDRREEKKLAYVPGHIRRTRNGAVVEALIRKYNNLRLPIDEREKYLSTIRALRDGTHPRKILAQADRNKLRKLPKGFRQETAPIVDPDGNNLYTRVFISPHYSPRLTPDAYENLESLFEQAVYVSKGSAIGYMEVALADMAGIEKG